MSDQVIASTIVTDEILARPAWPTKPGIDLLLPIDLVSLYGDAASFAASTNLRPGIDFMISNMIATPLPIYPSAFPSPRKRWEEMNPALMWHPLFWLPQSLSGRMTFQFEDDSSRLESVEEYAIRLAIELSDSEIYDQETGTWIDVLALAGLDAEATQVLARLTAWCGGADDGDLDAIDVSGFLAESSGTQGLVLYPAAASAAVGLQTQFLSAWLHHNGAGGLPIALSIASAFFSDVKDDEGRDVGVFWNNAAQAAPTEDLAISVADELASVAAAHADSVAEWERWVARTNLAPEMRPVPN